MLEPPLEMVVEHMHVEPHARAGAWAVAPRPAGRERALLVNAVPVVAVVAASVAAAAATAAIASAAAMRIISIQ